MTGKTKVKNPILTAVHETARDLHRQSLIPKRQLRQYDALCLEPIGPYSSEEIRAMREKHGMSQVVLATVLNVSVSTIRRWEQGDQKPCGPSLKLLNLLERKGLEAIL